MENKYQGAENKIILGDFIIAADKMDRDGGNKTQRLYRRCSKGQVYVRSTLILKFANNAKANHITVSFTDLIINYNAISIERLPSKIKIEKELWYFNSFLLCQPDFSSAAKNLLSLLKT